MWYQPVTRKELLEIIEQDGSSQISPQEFTGFSQLAIFSLHYIAYWREDPRTSSPIPTGIIVNAEESVDFLAWVATYISLRPFTAYCRIVESNALQYLAEINASPSSQPENCYLGLILAECARNIKTDEELKRLSPSNCESTLSFALARSITIGFRPSALDWIEGEWKKAKFLITRQKNSDDVSLISRTFAVAAALTSFQLIGDKYEQLILECARDIMQVGKIRDYNWSVLTSSHAEFLRAIEINRMPREMRLQLLRNAASTVAGTSDMRLKFAIGYLGSAIAPGTFDHHRTMKEIDFQISGAIYWYGLCSGLYRKNNLQAFSGGIGRRVVRDLERSDSIYGRPYCDIGIKEFEMLSAIEKKVDLPVGTPGNIEVELAPGVTTIHPLGNSAGERSADMNELLRELDFRLQDLLRLRNRLVHLIGPTNYPPLSAVPKSRKR
jgi:hypothetical protein